MTLKGYLLSLGSDSKRAETVRDIANRCGVTTGAVYHWVNGIRRPAPRHAVEIVKLTGGAVEIGDLISELQSLPA